MYYISALIAIVGAVSYQYFVKRVPSEINPIVSIIGVYICVLVFSLIVLPFFSDEAGFLYHFRKLSWIQIAVGGSVFLLELGFLLMFRYGWNLSAGNLVTSVFINLILAVLGVLLLGEKINAVNAIGIIISIVGVALIGYRS